MPKAAVLSSVDTDPQSSVVKKLPALLTSLKDPKYSEMSKEELETVCQDVFRKLKVTSEESDYLEECTKLQAQSSLWHHHRTGQITSSIFKKVTRASPINPPSSLVKIILSESSLDSSKVPSLNWGITHEDAKKNITFGHQTKSNQLTHVTSQVLLKRTIWSIKIEWLISHLRQTCQLSRISRETPAFAIVLTPITHTSSSLTQKCLLSGCSYHTLHVCICAMHCDITVTHETCTTAAKPPKRTYRDVSDRKHLEHGPLLPQQQ